MSGAPPNTPQHPSAEHSSAESNRSPLVRFGVSLGILVLIVILVVIYAFESGGNRKEIRDLGRSRAIQLEVQNGTGEQRLAQRATDFLRSEGFDVVEMGNYKSVNVTKTIVLDRTGNLEAAKSVAAALGVPQDEVLQQVDKNLFLDVTVVIGKDYNTLKAFR